MNTRTRRTSIRTPHDGYLSLPSPSQAPEEFFQKCPTMRRWAHPTQWHTHQIATVGARWNRHPPCSLRLLHRAVRNTTASVAVAGPALRRHRTTTFARRRTPWRAVGSRDGLPDKHHQHPLPSPPVLFRRFRTVSRRMALVSIPITRCQLILQTRWAILESPTKTFSTRKRIRYSLATPLCSQPQTTRSDSRFHGRSRLKACSVCYRAMRIDTADARRILLISPILQTSTHRSTRSLATHQNRT